LNDFFLTPVDDLHNLQPVPSYQQASSLQQVSNLQPVSSLRPVATTQVQPTNNLQPINPPESNNNSSAVNDLIDIDFGGLSVSNDQPPQQQAFSNVQATNQDFGNWMSATTSKPVLPQIPQRTTDPGSNQFGDWSTPSFQQSAGFQQNTGFQQNDQFQQNNQVQQSTGFPQNTGFQQTPQQTTAYSPPALQSNITVTNTNTNNFGLSDDFSQFLTNSSLNTVQSQNVPPSQNQQNNTNFQQ